MKRKIMFLLAVGILAAIITGAARLAYIARHDLVTLDVRKMDVRQVVKKIEWQTRETILVQTNVQGPVTLHVKNMPLSKALELVAEQTGARSSVLYPLYSSSKSLAFLKKILRGESRSSLGWTNLQSNAGGPRGFGGRPPGEGPPATNQLISLRIVARDLNFATLVLNRVANTRVIPEDGTAATISLTLDNDTAETAAEALAKKSNRQWTALYTLRGDFGPGRNGPGAGPSMANGSNTPRGPRPNSRAMNTEETNERLAERDVLTESILETLPADQRQEIEEAQAERQKQMQEMQSLTPEQRRERAMQMGAGPDRNLQRLKTSTPEQRATQRRQMAQMPPPGAPPFSRQ